MIQQLHRAQARCEDCHRAFHVPDPERSYACKACGGTVRAAARTHRRHLERAVTCAECAAINPHGGGTCAECGADLQAPEVAPPTTSRERPDQQLASEMRRAYKTIAGITWLYRLGALSYAVVTVIAVFALASADVPLQAGVLVVGLSTALTVLMLMAALQILFKPFVWTVIVASLATLVSVVHLVGPNPLGLAFYGSAAWAVAFWIASVPTLRLRKLIAEHTDLYITHHAKHRTKRALEGHTPEEQHERLLRAMRGAFRSSWKTSAVAGGLICLASVSGSYTVLANLRPEDFDATIADFETAWNDGNLVTVAGFFPREIQGRESAWMAGIAEGHGWEDALPRLGEFETRVEDDRRWVEFALADDLLTTCWALGGQSWYLIDLDLPIPKLEPTLERFLAAWRDSDPAAMAAFFPYEHVDRMRDSIVRSASRRDWARFPEILDTVTSYVTEKEAAVTLTVASGEVSTKWRFRNDGRWHLQALQFPKP